MTKKGVGVRWVPRSEPLAPCACVARGDVAHALGRALLAWDAARLARIEACAGDGVLVVLGEGAELPWLDGIVYLGRDEAAPHLLLPTNSRPDVPIDLFARALATQVAAPTNAGVVLPDAADGLLWIPVAAAGPIDRESLEAWTTTGA
jgi:hypothetical protein